jgi:signal peptide peptidase SppA
MSMDRYAHVIALVREQPWAIRRERLLVITDLLRFRASGERLTEEEIAARIGAGPARRESERPAGAVAVIPVYGVINQRADLMSEMSGGTSIERLARDFRAAIADSSVRAVLFDISSPGGGVYGVAELADEIRAARGKGKPIVAVANAMAASAAYWIASAVDELVVTPSGEVGSIGVYAAHQDVSEMMTAEGVKVTLLSAGEGKTDGNPFEPLSERARQDIQSRVEDYYGMFVRAVAKGRGVSSDVVRKTWKARVVGASEAVELGMADRVDTFDATLRRLLGRGASSVGKDKAEGDQDAGPRADDQVPPVEPPAPPPAGPSAYELAEMEAAQRRARTL